MSKLEKKIVVVSGAIAVLPVQPVLVAYGRRTLRGFVMNPKEVSFREKGDL